MKIQIEIPDDLLIPGPTGPQGPVGPQGPAGKIDETELRRLVNEILSGQQPKPKPNGSEPRSGLPFYAAKGQGSDWEFPWQDMQWVEVTNNNDDGPGSYRDACRKDAAYIVFNNVSGPINLKSNIFSSRSRHDLSINGQTSPRGVYLFGGGQHLASNMVMRHMRCYPGLSPDGASGKLSSRGGISRGKKAVRNVIYDHCGLIWGVDGFDAAASFETYQHSLAFQLLNYPSEVIPDAYDGYSKGSLIVGGDSITFYEFLWGGAFQRSPQVSAGAGSGFCGGENVELINCISYDHVNSIIRCVDNNANALKSNVRGNRLAIAGCMAIDGPDTQSNRVFLQLRDTRPGAWCWLGGNKRRRMNGEWYDCDDEVDVQTGNAPLAHLPNTLSVQPREAGPALLEDILGTIGPRRVAQATYTDSLLAAVMEAVRSGASVYPVRQPSESRLNGGRLPVMAGAGLQINYSQVPHYGDLRDDANGNAFIDTPEGRWTRRAHFLNALAGDHPLWDGQ